MSCLLKRLDSYFSLDKILGMSHILGKPARCWTNWKTRVISCFVNMKHKINLSIFSFKWSDSLFWHPTYEILHLSCSECLLTLNVLYFYNRINKAFQNVGQDAHMAMATGLCLIVGCHLWVPLELIMLRHPRAESDN